VSNTLDIEWMPNKAVMAVNIANTWMEWDQLRSSWTAQVEELRNYIFATDTTTTTNAQLPWKNKTTLPKLCQIRDNLENNYLAALFPNDDWLQWKGDDEESVQKEKRETIQAYMKTKLKQSKFEDETNLLLLDYIDTGNCFAIAEAIYDVKKHPTTGEELTVYTGPKMKRISPNDIVFNPTAYSFERSPKIVRKVLSIGDIERDLISKPYLKYDPEVLAIIKENRRAFFAATPAQRNKSKGFSMDGFGSLEHYFTSGYVELLEFYGDIYDIQEGELLRDRIITVVDRAYVIRNEENESWEGKSPIFHQGWRTRPDNLWAMGPLDNLVGMQYRIDHLENLKADVFDMIAYPVIKVRGDVEEFEYGPNERVYVGDDGDIDFMHPDATALGADMQINLLEQKMEEFAGAPKQAMGVRTPGEKTKYEVMQLENAAGRTFQAKITKFEKFLEDVVNSMFELSVRRPDLRDVIRIVDDDVGAVEFMNISKDDVTAKGRLVPVGARHFAAQAKLVQEMTAFAQSVGQDPAVKVHISGFRVAQMFEDLFGVEKFGLVKKNIGVLEAAETEQMKRTALEQIQVEGAMPVDQGDEYAEAGQEGAPGGTGQPPQQGGPAIS
jgi:hypothetical protein